jgi:Notch-like protein
VNTALGVCTLVAVAVLAGCFADRSGLAGLEGPGPRASCTPACENGGVCVVTDCFCEPVDYTGPGCSEWIDDCMGVDCLHGDCLDRVRSSSCDCHEGWAIDEGGLCSVQLLSCGTPNACIHGSCDDSSGVVVCTCEPGFEGTNCNVPVDCGNPPEPPSYTETGDVTGTGVGDVVVFNCQWGFYPASTSVVCQADGTWETPMLECADIDECRFGLGLCNPWGTELCANEYGSYECHCLDGWHGIYCHYQE